MAGKTKKVLIVTVVVVAIGGIRAWYHNDRARTSSERTSIEAQLADSDSGLMQRLRQSASDAEDSLPRLLFRVDGVAGTKGCEGRASQVFVGVDSNGDGRLEDTEQQRSPMTFCGAETVQGRVERTPPNAYCPRPGARVLLESSNRRPDSHAELIICFDPTRTSIESTFAVYDAR